MYKTAVILGLLSIVAVLFPGVHCADDANNKTIECVFRSYASCYSSIASLGTNFSVKYDQSEQEMNFTCKSENSVKQCILLIPTKCESLTSGSIVNTITAYIHDVCSNKTWQHRTFLNSSVCYNKNQQRRQNCMKKFDAGKNTDAKSLCCSSARQIRCLKSDMKGVCPSNSTDFHSAMMDTYRLHHTTLCATYVKKYCNSAVSSALSVMAVLFAAVFPFLLQSRH